MKKDGLKIPKILSLSEEEIKEDLKEDVPVISLCDC